MKVTSSKNKQETYSISKKILNPEQGSVFRGGAHGGYPRATTAFVFKPGDWYMRCAYLARSGLVCWWSPRNSQGKT